MTLSETTYSKADQVNSPETNGDKATAKRRKLQYKKAVDARGHKIRGLWVRNGRYYARIAIEDPKTNKSRSRRVRLGDAQTTKQALDALNDLRKEKSEN